MSNISCKFLIPKNADHKRSGGFCDLCVCPPSSVLPFTDEPAAAVCQNFQSIVIIGWCFHLLLKGLCWYVMTTRLLLPLLLLLTHVPPLARFLSPSSWPSPSPSPSSWPLPHAQGKGSGSQGNATYSRQLSSESPTSQWEFSQVCVCVCACVHACVHVLIIL